MRRLFRKELEIDPENWRKNLLTLILRVSAVLGFLVYLPSVYAAFRAGLIGIIVIDTFALAAILGLLVAKRLSFGFRAISYCLILYVLGVGLLIGVGPVSQIYLFGFSILATLLLGLRVGFYSALLSAATLFVVVTLGQAAPGMVNSTWDQNLTGLVVTALNFTLVNMLLTLALGVVLKALNSALKHEVAARVSLERERKLLRTLIDALPDVVFTKDTAGRYVNGNPATLAKLGLEREDRLAGKTDFDLFPTELAERYHAEDLDVIAGNPLRNREERSIGPAGSPVWYLTIKVPLHDAGGAIVGLIAISRDITDRKQAEAERTRLLAQLQMQIERMPLAYLLVDADFRFTRWNPAAERIFGYTEAEVLGKHPFQVVVPPQMQEFVGGIFEKVRAGSMETHGESQNMCKDGTMIVCEWRNTPILDEHGEFAGLLSLAQDITGRKKLEDQLRQSQKMEAVGKLAGGVAHDFNNLLTIITGYSNLLLTAPDVGAEVHDAARAINDAGERAAALTRQLLGFSRRMILQPKVLDLNAVVAETGKMLRRLIGEDILFTTVLAPNLGHVRVDPGQLDQILMNLAVNARDAMPRGGKLTIETTNVSLGADYAAAHPGCKAGDHVMLAMTDTGVGMTPDVLARVFEPFFTTKEVGKGTGLGLAMVFGIVQQSEGFIDVQSQPDQGSTFKIYFPAVTEPLSRLGDTPSFEATKGIETILLVEDEEGVRGLALLALQMHGYNVLTATDGKDALRVVENHTGPVDLILTDVVMPNVSGPALAQALKKRYPHLKVLFMSGYTDDAVFRHGLLEADVAFLQKPFTPQALGRKVRQVLDGTKGLPR